MIFSSKEWLIDEKNEQYFDGEEEKSSIEKALETAENWLENEGYDSTIDLYKSKKADLDKVIKPVKKRKQNRVALKKELKNLLTKINEVENKFDQYVSKKDWLP